MAAKQAEPVAEFEAIEGLPLPREQAGFVGHPEAERELLDTYRSERMHHAWILSGPKGIGKATLAFRFARFILAHPDRTAPELGLMADLALEQDHPAFRKVASGAHGDVLHLRRRWDEKAKRYNTRLAVDEIRRTVSFFGSTSSEGGWRVCIVDAADDMNASSSNALLKILEEPPERCVFFVISHQPGRLLPTIRSRCRMLPLKELEIADLRAGLELLELDTRHTPEDIAEATELADGSLRRAIELLETGGINVARALHTLLEGLPAVDTRSLHRFADMVSARGADDGYRIFLDQLRDWLDARVLAGAQAKVPPARLVRWAEVWDKTNASASRADALNLDRKQVVLGAFGALAGAVRDGAA